MEGIKILVLNLRALWFYLCALRVRLVPVVCRAEEFSDIKEGCSLRFEALWLRLLAL